MTQLVTINEVNEYFDNSPGYEIPAGGFSENMISLIERQFAEYCGRKDWGPRSNYIKYSKYNDVNIVYVDIWPIISITSIIEEVNYKYEIANSLSSDDYSINEINNGSIIFNSVYDSLKIEYNGGYDISDVPEDLKQAVYEQLRYTLRRQVPSSFAIDPGSYNEDNYPEWKLRGGSIIEEVKSILNKYKRITPFV